MIIDGHTLDYLLSEKGLSGLKLDLHTETGMLALRPDFKLNDSYLMPLWELLEKRGMTLSLDLGGSYGRPAVISEIAVRGGLYGRKQDSQSGY